jgi:iron complex transport system substrate-binding protein
MPSLNISNLQSVKSLFKLIFLSLFIISGCARSSKPASDQSAGKTGIVSRAERFSIDKKEGYTLLRVIDPWQGAQGVIQSYYLIERGDKLPEGIDSSSVIFVPVRKIVCMSTTHVAMIEALAEENSIAGVSGISFIYSPVILKNAEKGLIADVGYEANLNKELILKIKPDLIMIYGIGGESSGYVGKIKELGVKVIINADYLETDPLGRAEWIKLFGALYTKESLADSLFNSESEAYSKLKTHIAAKVTSRPKVLLGLPFKDAWYISPGNSFVSKLISDAGGDYLWADTRSAVSMPYGIENVYLKGLKADFWLNLSTVSTKTEISGIDPRLEDLPCFKKGNLYNNNLRINPNGGNDYWETGVLYPHLILEDIAKILHPDLFSDNTLFYYKKIN